MSMFEFDTLVQIVGSYIIGVGGLYGAHTLWTAWKADRTLTHADGRRITSRDATSLGGWMADSNRLDHTTSELEHVLEHWNLSAFLRRHSFLRDGLLTVNWILLLYVLAGVFLLPPSMTPADDAEVVFVYALLLLVIGAALVQTDLENRGMGAGWIGFAPLFTPAYFSSRRPVGSPAYPGADAHGAEPAGPPATIRSLHAFLTLGVTILSATLGLMSNLRGPLVLEVSGVGHVLAAAGAILLAIAFWVMRPRIPKRRRAQASADYWSEPPTRDRALRAWLVAAAAGTLTSVAYFLTGLVATAAVALLAILTLVWLKPARLEGSGTV